MVLPLHACNLAGLHRHPHSVYPVSNQSTLDWLHTDCCVRSRRVLEQSLLRSQHSLKVKPRSINAKQIAGHAEHCLSKSDNVLRPVLAGDRGFDG